MHVQSKVVVHKKTGYPNRTGFSYRFGLHRKTAAHDVLKVPLVLVHPLQPNQQLLESKLQQGTKIYFNISTYAKYQTVSIRHGAKVVVLFLNRNLILL
ncbi:hypothetical protein R6Q57_003363 [Mikania cordata]